jgi:hypothetical protein
MRADTALPEVGPPCWPRNADSCLVCSKRFVVAATSEESNNSVVSCRAAIVCFGGNTRPSLPVKGCTMPALSAGVQGHDRVGRAGVGQASREETAGWSEAVRADYKGLWEGCTLV